MNEQIQELLDKIRNLQDRVEQELEKNRAFYDLKNKLAEFREEVLARHKALKQGLLPYFRETHLRVVLTAPVIYSMLIPIFLLDIWVTIYQHVCFRAYKIPRVNRSLYVVFDRRHLAYLNGIEVLNCVYCSYGNGVFAYAREIASRTEQYWCPIKHARRIHDPHGRYMKFLEYGDAEGYRVGLEALREDVQKE